MVSILVSVNWVETTPEGVVKNNTAHSVVRGETFAEAIQAAHEAAAWTESDWGVKNPRRSYKRIG